MARDKLVKNPHAATSLADVRCPDCNWAMIHIAGVGWLCNTEHCPNQAQASRKGPV